MILTFDTPYRPLTSRPFLKNSTYREYAPCEALRPYVACFWAVNHGQADGAGIESGLSEHNPPGTVRVIPDTCIDMIIEVNYTKNRIKSRLCGIQDYTVFVNQRRDGDQVDSFAVRFYFWAARLFFDLEFRDLCNQVLDLDLIEPGSTAAFEPFFYCRPIRERMAWMEDFLLHRLEPDRHNANLYLAIDSILKCRGSVTVKQICESTCISQRQMERLFIRDIGISMKRTASLVRYQNVWGDVVRQKQFSVQDAVCRYGYSDQSHLLNEFRRFHGVWPEQAKRIALECV